jgi:hypothetical protein
LRITKGILAVMQITPHFCECAGEVTSPQETFEVVIDQRSDLIAALRIQREIVEAQILSVVRCREQR